MNGFECLRKGFGCLGKGLRLFPHETPWWGSLPLLLSRIIAVRASCVLLGTAWKRSITVSVSASLFPLPPSSSTSSTLSSFHSSSASFTLSSFHSSSTLALHPMRFPELTSFVNCFFPVSTTMCHSRLWIVFFGASYKSYLPTVFLRYFQSPWCKYTWCYLL